MSKYFITFYYIFWARVLVIVIVYCLILVSILQDVQTKMHLLSSFEFLTLGGVFLEVKNNYKNFGNKKNIGLFSKILSKWTLFCSKSSNFLEFSRLWHFQKVKNHLESLNIKYFDFSNDFYIFKTDKAIKLKKNGRF